MEFSIEYFRARAEVAVVVVDLLWAIGRDFICGGAASSLVIVQFWAIAIEEESGD
jgi:hypothetical protein